MRPFVKIKLEFTKILIDFYNGKLRDLSTIEDKVSPIKDMIKSEFNNESYIKGHVDYLTAKFLYSTGFKMESKNILT